MITRANFISPVGIWLMWMACAAPMQAAVLVQYDFEDGDGGSYLEPRATHANILASDISSETNDGEFTQDSAGDTRTDTGFDDGAVGAASGNKWNSIKASNPNSDNGEDFLTFSVSPEAGKTLNLDCINFMVAKSADETIGYRMRSNKTTLDVSSGAVTLISTIDDAWEWIMIDLDLIPEMQGITDEVSFKIVIDQAAGNVDLRFDKIELTGTVIPEPSLGLLLGAAGIMMCGFRRR